MKRDLDLARAILLALEQCEDVATSRITIDGFSEEQVRYHLELLADAGLIAGETIRLPGRAGATLSRLTWQGHDFVDSSRKSEVWQAAKARIEQAGVFTFDVLKAILVEIVKKKIGLSD